MKNVNGHLMMPVPEISIEQAITNMDAVVEHHQCDRHNRMAFEQSLKVIRDMQAELEQFKNAQLKESPPS